MNLCLRVCHYTVLTLVYQTLCLFVMVHDESMMLCSCQFDPYCYAIVHYLTWSHLHVYILCLFVVLLQNR
jgi:hypothetical protein